MARGKILTHGIFQIKNETDHYGLSFLKDLLPYTCWGFSLLITRVVIWIMRNFVAGNGFT